MALTPLCPRSSSPACLEQRGPPGPTPPGPAPAAPPGPSVGEWLRGLGLGGYEEPFRSAGVTGLELLPRLRSEYGGPGAPGGTEGGGRWGAGLEQPLQRGRGWGGFGGAVGGAGTPR